MANVIRRENAPPVLPFAFQDVEQRAEELLAAARAQADRLLAEARQQSSEIEQRARQLAAAQARTAQEQGHLRGLAEGRAQGRATALQEARQAALTEARTEIQRLTSALASGLSEHERNIHGLLADAESGLLELALAIARRVCKCLVATSIEPARANCQALLELVKNQSDLVLALHPADYDLLRSSAPDFFAQLAALEHVTVQPGPEIARGGCVLRTADGVIDTSIEGQLGRIAAALCPGQLGAT